jgi:cell division transport system permease protein
VIQVLPKDSLEEGVNMTGLMEQFKKLPEVEFVQMDMQWVERLRSIMLIAGRGVALISVLLSLAVAFITGNTIRLELQNRQEEVYISKLVGATQSFIQRPFLYAGFWLGFLGGFVAWLIVTLMLLILQEPVEHLSKLYDGAFQLLFMSFSEFILLLMISSSLAVLGAWAVLHYQLQKIRPE